MKSSNTCNHFPHVVICCLVTALIVTVLFIDNIYLMWTIIALLGIDALYLALRHGWRWWRSAHSKIALREHFLTFLASLMFLFLVTGTALFMAAFVYEQADGKGTFINSEYLLRSLSCSFQLFAGSIDSNVVDGICDYPYLKGLISMQAILSFCCTIAVLLSLAFARVTAYFKLHRKTDINSAHNHLFIFFGINASSRLLAKSIRDSEGDRAVIVFVENRIQNDENQNGLDNIVGMFTHRRQTFIDVDELDARVTFTEIRLCDISGDELSQTDILGELNLIKLRDLMLKLDKGVEDAQMHIFFLSENEDENIRSLSVLAIDNTIQQTKTSISQHLYCHARRNGLNRIIEDIAFKQGLDVRTIDSSYLAVELLKADEMNHPVRFVDIDSHNPTTVKSPFNSLIIGFDEVGHDALKFLYEFGAFIDINATPIDEQRSPFHCVVLDKRMHELEGSFANFAPSVMKQKNNDDEHSPLLELKKCDCQSRFFYDSILKPKLCENLNYIVIAVGDDELGMTLAIRILNHIRRVRSDLRLLRIFVRSYRPDKEAYMQKIATYYNEGYNRGLTKNEPYQTEAIIKLFGQSKYIYSYDLIVNEKLIQIGRKYQASYAHLKGETTLWNDRRKKLLKAGSLDSIRKLRRQELQDLGNALHAETKIYLLKKAFNENFDWEDFFRRYFDDNNMPHSEGKYDNIKYPLLSPYENKVILNLARLEHMRWNASHEMLGYVQAHSGLHQCDERTHEHNCLRPWQELDDESRATLSSDWPSDYKAYDFSVVDNTILLNMDKLLTL